MGLFEENMADIVFKAADNRQELEAAYTLVHNKYVCEGYIDKHPSGMRLRVSYAFPGAATFIAKQGDTILTTLTVFPVSPFGLPSDAIFKEEIDEIRQGSRKVVEVGSFASTIHMFRVNPDMPHYINKIMLDYVIKVLDADDVIITINPKHLHAYEDILLYKRKGEIKYYPDVKNNPAILLHLDLSVVKEQYKEKYGAFIPEKNLFDFYFTHPKACIHCPEDTPKVWDKSIFDYFFNQRTDIKANTNSQVLEYIEKNL